MKSITRSAPAEAVKNRRAFTLIEMLVAVVILGILTAIAIPIFNGITDNANIKAFESNHAIIVSAINMYISAHNGEYPRTVADLTDNNYLINDSGADIKLDGATADGYTNNPGGAKYKLEFSTTAGKGFKLTSTYKDQTKTYTRGTMS